VLKLHIVPGIPGVARTPVLDRIQYGVEGDAPGVLITLVGADQSTVSLFEEDFLALRAPLHALGLLFSAIGPNGVGGVATRIANAVPGKHVKSF
jgi:hypothetical protein